MITLSILIFHVLVPLTSDSPTKICYNSLPLPCIWSK